MKFYSKLDGINIQLPWSTTGSSMEYGYGSYMSGSGGLSLDVSPTELKSMPGSYSSGSYTGGQYTSVSPVPPGGGSWYSPSDGNIHVLHTGEVLRKVDPGRFYSFYTFLINANCEAIDVRPAH